ncbi:MAG: regulatory protein RecX [Blautia sp.]|nr:regulatory protein RecX [Blautia sp.]
MAEASGKDFFDTGEKEDVSQDFVKARKKAMQLLERMDRPQKDLEGRLARAGFSEAAISDAIAYVSSYGYLNDRRYALNYIRRMSSSQSRRRITYDLMQKGISQELAEAVWEESEEEEFTEERTALRSLVEKRFCEGSTLSQSQLRKLYAYLARRGFAYEDIRHVLDEMDISYGGED